MRIFIKKRPGATSEIRTIGKLAFVFITILIVFCALLMNVGLGIQRDMLQASSISYEQRVLVEDIGKRMVFLMKNVARVDMSDRSINDVRQDMLKITIKLNNNQSNLKDLVLGNKVVHLLDGYYLGESIFDRIDEVDVLLDVMGNRIAEINNATMPSLRSAYNFWSSADILLAKNGRLPEAMELVNDGINRALLDQNRVLYFFYATLLILMLVSVWLVWYLTLRPLAERLEENYMEIRSKNESLAFQAHHDSLTKLPNRPQFMRLMKQLNEEGGLLNRVALIIIDIDNFKSINDNYGHQAGDDVLVEFSHRLAIGKTENESLFRLSGDEFAIVISEVPDKDHLIKRAEIILKNLRAKSTLFKRNFSVNGSMGIAWGDRCGSTLQELFSAADMALYYVKDNGRNGFALFEDINTLKISDLLELEQELYRAVDNHEFTVFYQPIIDLDDNKIVKLEALVRWQHPEKGVLLPQDWMLIAEKISVFSAINMQVFDIVERDFKSWQDKGLACCTIFVNITESLLLSGMGLERILDIMKKSQSPKPWIGVEVTESIILDRSFDLAKHQLSLMQSAGIKIALDDFGTGFANLSHLNTIPFDTIKIDTSFVSNILSDESMFLIVESIIALANKLDKEVVCEGVDDEETKNVLRQMGCQFSQGFLHSYPLSSSEVVPLLLKRAEFNDF